MNVLIFLRQFYAYYHRKFKCTTQAQKQYMLVSMIIHYLHCIPIAITELGIWSSVHTLFTLYTYYSSIKLIIAIA